MYMMLTPLLMTTAMMTQQSFYRGGVVFVEIKHQNQYKPWTLNQTSQSNSHNISYRSGGCRVVMVC